MVSRGSGVVQDRAARLLRVRKQARRRRSTGNLLEGLLWVSPWMVGFLGLLIYPMIASFYYSFTSYPILSTPVWTGPTNYRTLLTDRLFKMSVSNTAYYTAFSVPGGIILALLLAILMNQKIHLRPLYRTMFYLPVLVPGVSTAILWLWLLDTRYGLVNAALHAVGLRTVPWFTSIRWSKPALILMSWWGVGGTMLIFLAALQDVPRSLYDAAEIDGANALQRARRVTLPMISPAIFFALVTGVIGAMQTFTSAFFTSQGGPANSSLTYGLYVYHVAFMRYSMGYGCTLAWVLFGLIIVLTLLIFRSSSAWVFYAGGGGAE